MIDKKVFPKPNRSSTRLRQRIAEEAQLLAEEKWIIEALKKIKAQRNGLQIERLHLEGMRAEILERLNNKQEASAFTTSESKTDEPSVEIPSDTITIPEVNVGHWDLLDKMTFNSHNINDDDICNTEQLNLCVTNSVFNTEPFGPTCDEEEEEEEEDEDLENCVLDIDLLMSGK